MKTTFALLIVAALALISGVPARARDAVVPANSQTNVASPATAAVKHVLVSTFIDQGDADAALKKGKIAYAFGNVTSITCAAACTLEVEMMAQVGGSKATANTWDVCAYLDNKTFLGPCAYQGTLPTDGGYVIGNYAWSVSLAKGTHTVQPTAYVTDSADVANYHAAYRVYQP